ncbi:MAG TPA: DUF1553 domain-containing protein [Planctomycetaceae bacterium]|nr:DUF1553 domain-containing protein [Planctomycetaceae bacterium]
MRTTSNEKESGDRSPHSKALTALVCAVLAAGVLFNVGESAASGPVGNDSGDENAAAAPGPAVSYRELVLADKPVAYWSFDEASGQTVANRAETGEALDGTLVGTVKLAQAGPRSGTAAAFRDDNTAVEFSGRGGFIRVADPGEGSVLDFGSGDAITLEAWVKPAAIRDGQHVYIVGKGRTNNAGFPKDNQNYALRLTGAGGTARVSFLFRNVANRPGNGRDFHRWTADSGFVPDGRWHHVAVSYTFGEKDSLGGYIDGEPVGGTWDMGGAIDHAPVVDDDELWIGSSLGGSGGNTFNGLIDEAAIYRAALAPERIRLRAPSAPKLVLADIDPPSDAVLVEIIEGIPDRKSWDFTPPAAVESYREPAFAFVEVPRKYNERGVQIDRTSPFMLRASSRIDLPAGRHEFLVRCRSGARLFVDGTLIAQTPFHNIPNNGHGQVRDVSKVKQPGLKRLAMGDNEALGTFESDGGPHVFVLDVFVGGGKLRPELGETSVSVQGSSVEGRESGGARVEGQESRAGQSESAGGQFVLLSPTESVPVADASWRRFVAERSAAIGELNAVNRRKASVAEAEYWERRHKLAREIAAQQPAPAVPDVPATMPVHNEIDRFIGRKLADAGQAPAALADDWAFVRRVALDVIGTIPTPEQIAEFRADQRPDRRARYIDRLLEHPGWADHWVAYWQDVLAENPNIVNPTLNNTGPFRWWIHESFVDNKPFDRFVTELVMMEGSTYYGGPAGFALATQNDSPMAAKAHILGEAFLGVEMQCARCHDAPFHNVKQRDLFALAGLLNREPLAVPKTSTIPLDDESLKSLIVKVTLRPGEAVPPEWPFADIAGGDLPDGMVRRPDDSRETLAALLTSPHNRRFAQVIVNRLWKRYLGHGLVEPVHDWENADRSHTELLDWLAREFVTSGYDLKHVARLILGSHAYQRVPTAARPDGEYLFAAPVQRRMTAEQIVDSLFLAAGKDFNAGPMSADIDGARHYDQSLSLGVPRRAWQFTSLSNERDRPSLALPFAQPFVDVLEAVGWRSSRQNPINERDTEPNVVQPAILLNGVLAARITRLSDDSTFTQLALAERPLNELIDAMVLKLLSRPPSDDERELLTGLLSPGYAGRVIDDPDYVAREPLRYRDGVSWSNHLSPEANEIKVEMERLVQAGDPPSGRLDGDWRERMEDVIWTLMSAPEFVFVP